jgi:hypothetical protein
VIRVLGGLIPMIERSIALLPLPDSPITASTPPRGTVKEVPSTARTAPRRLRNSVTRSVTRSAGSVGRDLG